MFCEVISTAASIFLSFHEVAPQEMENGWVWTACDMAATSPSASGSSATSGRDTALGGGGGGIEMKVQ